jgi:hypothetical protein
MASAAQTLLADASETERQPIGDTEFCLGGVPLGLRAMSLFDI